MKTVFVLLAFCGLSFAQEGIVVIPKNNKPFIVSGNSLVRLTKSAAVGSEIEIKIEGPAKLDSTNVVYEIGELKIGASAKEFNLKMTGTGNVTVTIVVKPPNPKGKVQETKYEFVVK